MVLKTWDVHEFYENIRPQIWVTVVKSFYNVRLLLSIRDGLALGQVSLIQIFDNLLICNWGLLKLLQNILHTRCSAIIEAFRASTCLWLVHIAIKENFRRVLLVFWEGAFYFGVMWFVMVWFADRWCTFLKLTVIIGCWGSFTASVIMQNLVRQGHQVICFCTKWTFKCAAICT